MDGYTDVSCFPKYTQRDSCKEITEGMHLWRLVNFLIRWNNISETVWSVVHQGHKFLWLSIYNKVLYTFLIILNIYKFFKKVFRVFFNGKFTQLKYHFFLESLNQDWRYRIRTSKIVKKWYIVSCIFTKWNIGRVDIEILLINAGFKVDLKFYFWHSTQELFHESQYYGNRISFICFNWYFWKVVFKLFIWHTIWLPASSRTLVIFGV